jgi:hypothetical protein
MQTLLKGLNAFRNYLIAKDQEAKEQALAAILDAAIDYIGSKESVTTPAASGAAAGTTITGV